MPSLNKVMLIGFFGKDPEVRYSQSGDAFANVSLATDESYKNKEGEKVEKTEWHNLTFFGKQAEAIGKYTGKGSKMYVEGKLQTRKWQDKEGNDRYTTEIRVFSFEFLDSKAESKGPKQDEEKPAAEPKKAPAKKAAPQQDALDDDIPF